MEKESAFIAGLRKLAAEAGGGTAYVYPDDNWTNVSAEAVEVGGGLAYIRLYVTDTGVTDRVFGDRDPLPVEKVAKMAAKWNSSATATWPDGWIIPPAPTSPITAAALLDETKGYGPTLDVKVQLGPDAWRTYAPTKEKLRDDLGKLAPDAPAVLRFTDGVRVQCFGSTLSVFGPEENGVCKIADVAEYASIAIYGETIDPA